MNMINLNYENLIMKTEKSLKKAQAYEVFDYHKNSFCSR